MTKDLFLRRKWTLRAHGEQVVFVKRANERGEHVLMKAFLWALYLPSYPDLVVEVPVRDRYKPDVVSLDTYGRPHFWGEAGHVSPDKVHSLVRRYRETHFALAKWDTPLDPFIATAQDALRRFESRGPFDLLRFPPDSAERFISDRGEINVTHADLDWVQLS
jgi:hypothetical protein